MAKSSLDIFKERLKQSQDYCYPHWERAIENYKHYLGRLDVGNANTQNYPFVSKMVIPVSYETVETVMPRIIGKDPEFTTMAMEPDDVPFENAAKVTIQTEYDNPKLDLLGQPIYLTLQRGVKEELITGNVVYRVKWRRQTRKIVRYLANLEGTGHTDEEDIKKVLEYAKKIKDKGGNGDITWTNKLEDTAFLDDFDLEHKPFFQFLPDSGFPETGRMRYKIESENITFEELADEATIFHYEESVMNELADKYEKGELGFSPEVNKDFLYKYNELFSNPQIAKQTGNIEDAKKKLIKLDKMWEGDRVHVFVNEKYQLTPDEEGMRNPYNVMVDPFVFGGDVVIPYSYFNLGEIDAIKKIENGITDIHNMRFDNLVQSMLNLWVYNPNMMADGDEFLPIPGSMTAVKDIDRAVRMFSGQDVTGSAYKESDTLMQIVSRVTGANDYVKGMEGDSVAGRSYGGIRLVQEAANARFVVKSRLFEKQTLKALGYFILELSRQFINKDRFVRLAGRGTEEDQRVLIKAADLKQIKGFMDIKVTPNSATVIDQQAEIMRMNAVADRFSAGKGPFANIPQEVFDQFLLKYLQINGFNDAVYWVRMIREARDKAQKDVKKDATNPGGENPTPENAIAPPTPTEPVMQPDQIATQPNPLAQILAAGTTPPPPQVITS